MSGPRQAARDAKRALRRMARPAGHFDASRYFRGDSGRLGFYNVGTGPMRALARTIHARHKARWSIDDAVAFAEQLIVDRHLEAKGVAVELMALYRRAFTPRLLAVWKRWLADGHSANWATTDAICGYLVGPLIVARPSLATLMRPWARHRSLWVRRASAVALVPSARRGVALDVAYDVARRLHADRNDLIQKAAGWLLREAGRTDPARLQRYLVRHGRVIPRTTVRYAIERMAPRVRKVLLEGTRGASGSSAPIRRSVGRSSS